MNVQSSFFRSPQIAMILLGLLPGLAAAEESAASLYQEHCTKCHQSEVFTRADHKITSYDALVRQVQRCELALDLTWFDDQIEGVADYVNKRFYHFKH